MPHLWSQSIWDSLWRLDSRSPASDESRGAGVSANGIPSLHPVRTNARGNCVNPLAGSWEAILMDGLVLSFHARVQHGCLVIRDISSEDDISNWDPTTANWYREGGSIIFGVLPASEGWVDCEIWSGDPVGPLPILLFDEQIPSETGRLVVHDASEDLRTRFRVGRGGIDVRIAALVDDRNFASEIQLSFWEV